MGKNWDGRIFLYLFFNQEVFIGKEKEIKVG